MLYNVGVTNERAYMGTAADEIEDMGLKHAVVAILTLNLAEQGDIDWEIDTNGHNAIWVSNAQGEKVLVNVTQVE